MGQVTQTVATFTGTLLQRHRAPGKPFTQLIFREAGKDWLCLSSNIARAAKLQIGKKYKIEGIFKSLDDRSYIHEPDIVAIGSRLESVRRWGLYVGLVLMIATLTTLAVRAVHGSLASSSAETTSTQTRHPSKISSDSAVPVQAGQTVTPTAETPAPAPVPTPAPKKKTTTPVTVPQPSPSTPNPAPAPPLDCDAPVVTKPYAHTTQYDPSQPEGTPVQQGVNEESTTCYPNGRDQPGQTSVTTQGKDEIVTTQTP